MKCVAVATLLSLALCASGTSVATSHPVSKVIELLSGLEAKTKEEGQTEALAYEKFVYWCKNSKKTLNKAIEEEKETISSLEDNIEAKTKEQASLEKEIEKLDEQLTELNKAAAAAKKDRKETNDMYLEAEADFKSTITAVEDAVKALEASKKAGPSLVQTETEEKILQRPEVRKVLALAEARATTEEQRSMLASVLSQRPEQLAKGDRQSHVRKYSFKSGNIIELLKTLKLDFEDQLLQATKEETASLNAYELSKKARDNAIDAAESSKKEKNKILSDVKQTLIDDKASLKSTKGDLEADTTEFEETEKDCALKAQEWDERSKVRAGELAAMAAAKKILAKAANVRSEAPSNPVPPVNPAAVEEDAPASFLQISDPRKKAIELIRASAKRSHSKAMEKLADQMTLRSGDAFGDVNNMIEKMIFRLMNEQKEEDEHKLWCDKEISQTNASIIDKEEKVEELTDKIDEDVATSQELAEDIVKATKMVADITSFMEEATEIRETGKEENRLALKDAQDAQTALANAIAVLEDFYKESGMVKKEPYEFVQRGAEPVKLGKSPSTWDSGYTGVSDPKDQPDGIIAVLKETASEFSAMEADTRAQEATDQKEYDEEMQTSKIEKARRSKEIEMKTAEKKRLDDKIESLKKTRKGVEGELELTVQYMKDLEKPCMDGSSSYDERKEAREDETEALRKAQGILKDAFKEKPKGKFLEISRH